LLFLTLVYGLLKLIGCILLLIIKVNPVPIWPRMPILCETFSQDKTRENFANTLGNLPGVNESRSILANFVVISIIYLIVLLLSVDL